MTTRPPPPALGQGPRRLCAGRGLGVLVLEEYEHAKARGAKIYAEIVGFGMGADAFHMTAPNVDGPKRSMRAALRDAGLNPTRSST